MNLRKLAMLGVFSLIGVLAFEADTQAGLRKKKNQTCDTCAAPVQTYAAPVQNCGGCGNAYGGRMAYDPAYGGTQMAMPMPGNNRIVPASGVVNGSGYVEPATYYTTPTTSAPTRRGLFRR